MKKHFLFFLFVAFHCILLNGQVTTVKYAIEYNHNTNLYDCFVLVGSGATRPDMHTDRILFNSQFTVVSHVGTNVSIEDLNMPLLDNIDGNGTEPQSWVIANTFSSPIERPDLKYHSIIPKLAPVAHFNNLFAGSKVRLFSLSANPVDTCEYKLRLFDKQVDKYTFDGIDFNNGFTVGGPTQLYLGNVEDNFVGGDGPIINVDSAELCLDNSILLQSPSDGMWHSTDPSVAQFDNEELVLIDTGMFFIWFLEDSTLCNSNLSGIQRSNPIPNIDYNNIESLIIGDSLQLNSDLDCTWSSSNPSVAVVDNSGLVRAVSPGMVIIMATSIDGGCSNQISLEIENVSSTYEVENHFSIYPNPASYQLWIEGLDESDIITIYQSNGAKVEVDINEGVIDVKDLHDGLYLITIESKGKVVKQKFVKSSY